MMFCTGFVHKSRHVWPKPKNGALIDEISRECFPISHFHDCNGGVCISSTKRVEWKDDDEDKSITDIDPMQEFVLKELMRISHFIIISVRLVGSKPLEVSGATWFLSTNLSYNTRWIESGRYSTRNISRGTFPRNHGYHERDPLPLPRLLLIDYPSYFICMHHV